MIYFSINAFSVEKVQEWLENQFNNQLINQSNNDALGLYYFFCVEFLLLFLSFL